MYSFEPSDEQQMLIDVINKYAINDLRKIAHEADESGVVPSAVLEKGWELGVLQAAIPEVYGGFGERSLVSGVLALEEMAYGDLAATIAVMTPALFALPILVAGTERQKETYLPAIVEAKWQPYTAAIIEPYYDFDVNELRTVACKEEGGFLLNGQKNNVPFVKDAPEMLVYANLEGKTRAFIVPRDSQGVTIGERHKLMGIHALPNYPVKFENVHIPVENFLDGGEVGSCAALLDAMRLSTAAMALGTARAAFEYARDYAKEREAFGVKIAQKQAIAFMLAEMITEIEALRMLIWEAAWMADAGKADASKQAYLAYYGAVETVMMVTDRAVQILGGHGYIREHPVEKWMREGRGFASFCGMAII